MNCDLALWMWSGDVARKLAQVNTNYTDTLIEKQDKSDNFLDFIHLFKVCRIPPRPPPLPLHWTTGSTIAKYMEKLGKTTG